jgi:hypothetical protein
MSALRHVPDIVPSLRLSIGIDRHLMIDDENMLSLTIIRLTMLAG